MRASDTASCGAMYECGVFARDAPEVIGNKNGHCFTCMSHKEPKVIRICRLQAGCEFWLVSQGLAH